MRLPDFNIGYVFGFGSEINSEGLLVTFLGGIVRIRFRYKDIEEVSREIYSGGRISWDVIRWGKCPPGTDALRVVLKNGPFRKHLIVFDRPDAAIEALKGQGIATVNS